MIAFVTVFLNFKIKVIIGKYLVTVEHSENISLLVNKYVMTSALLHNLLSPSVFYTKCSVVFIYMW